MRDTVPLLIPAVPFGFVIGLTATRSAMPTAVAASSSVFVFAGASQLATLTLAGSATVFAVLSAAFVINARHLMYGAALAPRFRTQPRWFRWFAGFILIDQVFALSIQRADLDPTAFRRYYITSGVLFWVNWQLMTVGGMVLGSVIPDAWRLAAAPPIMFLSMVVIAVRMSPEVAPRFVAAVVGVAVGLAAAGLPDRTGILIGAFAGVVAGTATDYALSARSSRQVEQHIEQNKIPSTAAAEEVPSRDTGVNEVGR